MPVILFFLLSLAACRSSYTPYEATHPIDYSPMPEYEPTATPVYEPEPDHPPICDCGSFLACTIEEWLASQFFATHPPDAMHEFDTVHEVAYLQWEPEFPCTIVISTPKPVYDFSFVTVQHNAICCGYVGEALLTLDKLYPSEAVAITVAFSHYLFPRAAVMFTDVCGTRHHMYLFQNMAGGCIPPYELSHTNNP